jgi:hypothetical protein
MRRVPPGIETERQDCQDSFSRSAIRSCDVSEEKSEREKAKNEDERIEQHFIQPRFSRSNSDEGYGGWNLVFAKKSLIGHSSPLLKLRRDGNHSSRDAYSIGDRIVHSFCLGSKQFKLVDAKAVALN